MWPQNTIQTINPNELNAVGSTPAVRPDNLKPKLSANIVGNSREEEEDMTTKMQKVYGASFGGGIVFLVIFLLLVMSGKIVLSGPYLPIFLPLFPQKLEFVIRYQALGLMPIVINVVIVGALRVTSRSAFDQFRSTKEDIIQRFSAPLHNSVEQFLMSTIIQMVMAANLEAEQVMAFCPFLAITFLIGRIAYLATYPKFHHFGFAVSFLPTLFAVLFNGYGALKFVFT